MHKTLPDGKFLFAKLDTQMRVVYVNAFYGELYQRAPVDFHGRSLEKMKLPGAPGVTIELLINTVQERGFSCALLPFTQPGGDVVWALVDFTRRYGAREDSGLLGYEYVGYPTSEAAMNFFAQLYSRMLHLEQQQCAESARDYFQNAVAETGKTYEELVHTLQHQ